MIHRLALGFAAALLLPPAAGEATYSAKPVNPVAAKRIVVPIYALRNATYLS